jgi:hypothetical protein
MGQNIKKENVQAEWMFKGFEPENCSQIKSCDTTYQLRKGVEDSNE